MICLIKAPKTKAVIFAMVLTGASVFNFAFAQTKSFVSFSTEPYNMRTYDGKSHNAELFKMLVKENPAKADSKTILVCFVRLKAKTPSGQAPVVFLSGGPGIPGIGIAKVPVYYALFDTLQQTRDVILLDQRGCGLSTPNLQSQPASLSDSAFLNEGTLLHEMTVIVKKTADSLRKTGVDLSAYTTDNIGRDVDNVRQVLNAGTISLLAWSYGTELALSYAKQFPDKMDKLVMMGTQGPDDLLIFPSAWDFHLKKISWLAARDSSIHRLMPSMDSALRVVLNSFEKKPVQLEITDKMQHRTRKITVGKIGILTLIREGLPDTRAMAGLPNFVYSLYKGDYSQLTKRMEAVYNGFVLSLMELSVDCSGGASPQRISIVQQQTPGAIMSNVNLQWSKSVCDLTGAGQLGDVYRQKKWNTAPALFITGSLDNNTPIEQAEEARQAFPNSSHIIVENGGHQTIPVPEVQHAIVDFMAGKAIKSYSIVLPEVSFQKLN